jgi:hypothetical protein
VKFTHRIVDHGGSYKDHDGHRCAKIKNPALGRGSYVEVACSCGVGFAIPRRCLRDLTNPHAPYAQRAINIRRREKRGR